MKSGISSNSSSDPDPVSEDLLDPPDGTLDDRFIATELGVPGLAVLSCSIACASKSALVAPQQTRRHKAGTFFGNFISRFHVNIQIFMKVAKNNVSGCHNTKLSNNDCPKLNNQEE